MSWHSPCSVLLALVPALHVCKAPRAHGHVPDAPLASTWMIKLFPECILHWYQLLDLTGCRSLLRGLRSTGGGLGAGTMAQASTSGRCSATPRQASRAWPSARSRVALRKPSSVASLMWKQENGAHNSPLSWCVVLFVEAAKLEPRLHGCSCYMKISTGMDWLPL